MKQQWTEVPLGELLKRSNEIIDIIPDIEYREVTVKLWGKGVILRGTVAGSEISGNRRYIAHSGQFIISKIDARNGASGIIPSNLDGAIVTNDFPLFDIDNTKVEPSYFNWLSKTSYFIQLCSNASEGTTNRIRLKEKKFLQLMIPLPSLLEQRKIVTKIEQLSAKIKEACSLRKQTVEESSRLKEAYIGTTLQKFIDNPKAQLKTLATKIGSGSTPLGGRASYLPTGIPFIRSLNIRMRCFSWDNIAYISPDIHSQMKGTRVFPNDVLLNITGASIGRVACAPQEIAEANVNQHVSIIRTAESLEPRFLMYWLSQPIVQDYINNEQKGGTRQGFTKSQIEALEIPVLSLDEQRFIVNYLDRLVEKVDCLYGLQSETESELGALLPIILKKAFKEDV